MDTEIDRDSQRILGILASKPRDQYVPAAELASEAKLPPERINDAVALLVDSGHVEWTQVLGTAPFDFGDVSITSRGRYEHQRLAAASSAAQGAKPEGPTISKQAKPPIPEGSPFGFTDLDWEEVARHKARVDRLYVVLGHQFASTFYDSDMLRHNVKEMFAKAVEHHNSKRRTTTPIELKFSLLAAGYGEHLFNEIARGIIGSDIAVFETSDLNANVMLEMGVALTWGVRVLPIKAEGRPTPPSDVSGQTWADYRNSAAEFQDPDHRDKLVAMIERALRKKGPAV